MGQNLSNERIFLLKTVIRIIFNSNWSKKRFLEKMNSDAINSEKLIVIHQSATKNKINFKKKKIITFVGKLNKSKGYDFFGKAVLRILNKYKDWKAFVAGDELRDKIDFNHNRLIKLGFQRHKEIINLYKVSSIAVVCSRWDEPFGRTSLEASANGCAVIISDKEAFQKRLTNGVILKSLTVNEIYNKIIN